VSQPSRPARHQPDPGLVSGGRVVPRPRHQPQGADQAVVVRSGDTLWSIAARTLRPRAGAVAITSAWHRWYAANRTVIGADPGLIYPGQQLHAPRAARTPNPHPRSTP
jgi:nucleoid-associated protein YgaU